MFPSLTNKESAGGLGVAIEESLKKIGGVWFGWSGEISNEENIKPEILKNFELKKIAALPDGFSLVVLPYYSSLRSSRVKCTK